MIWERSTNEGSTMRRSDNPSPDRRPDLIGLADLAMGVVLLGVGVFALVWIHTVKPLGIAASTGALDYSSFPTFCSVLLIVLSCIYILSSIPGAVASFRDFRRARPLMFSWRLGDNGWRRIGTVILLVAYVVSMKILPFFVATTGFLSLMFVLYGQRSPIAVIAVACLGSGLLTGIFVYALKLPI